jgi:hypothetical protein
VSWKYRYSFNLEKADKRDEHCRQVLKKSIYKIISGPVSSRTLTAENKSLKRRAFSLFTDSIVINHRPIENNDLFGEHSLLPSQLRVDIPSLFQKNSLFLTSHRAHLRSFQRYSPIRSNALLSNLIAIKHSPQQSLPDNQTSGFIDIHLIFAKIFMKSALLSAELMYTYIHKCSVFSVKNRAKIVLQDVFYLFQTMYCLTILALSPCLPEVQTLTNSKSKGTR